jgi:hypothetical protein
LQGLIATDYALKTDDMQAKNHRGQKFFQKPEKNSEIVFTESEF